MRYVHLVFRFTRARLGAAGVTEAEQQLFAGYRTDTGGEFCSLPDSFAFGTFFCILMDVFLISVSFPGIFAKLCVSSNEIALLRDCLLSPRFLAIKVMCMGGARGVTSLLDDYALAKGDLDTDIVGRYVFFSSLFS